MNYAACPRGGKSDCRERGGGAVGQTGRKRLETEVSRKDVTSMTSADTSAIPSSSSSSPETFQIVTDYRKHLSRPPEEEREEELVEGKGGMTSSA